MKREIKKITVITPSYNCVDKIEKTILSVINQKNSFFEFIICDNQSTDGTIEILKKYENEIDNIIIEKDNGIYDAMNKGIKAATGDYLYFLGAGDFLEKDILYKVQKYFNEDLIILVYGNVYDGNYDKKYDGKFNKFKIASRNICHQSAFYDKRIFDILGNYDEKYTVFSDYAFNIKCFGNKYITKKYIPEVIAFYEGSGVSCRIFDKAFRKDFPTLVKKNLGTLTYLVMRLMKLTIKLIKKLKRI